MPWDEIVARDFPSMSKDLDGISRQTMEDHYKLYQGYVKKTNACRKILNEFDYSEIEGNQVYSELRAVSVDYTFALLGFKNHDLYFGHLGGSGGEPSGRFAEIVEGEFNGVGQFGSGWTWLVLDGGSLKLTKSANQDSPILEGQTPLLGNDVWEHAYYLKYQNKRPDYLKAWWNVVNWDKVAERYSAAK